jgi:hypothetical protein
LGGSLDSLRSAWWVITINANTSAPRCFVLTREEVKGCALSSTNGQGTVSWWLEPRFYILPEFEEAWDRLGSPTEAADTANPI